MWLFTANEDDIWFGGLSSPPSSSPLLQVMDTADSPNGDLFQNISAHCWPRLPCLGLGETIQAGKDKSRTCSSARLGFYLLLKFQTEISPVLLSTEIMNIITSPHQVPETTSWKTKTLYKKFLKKAKKYWRCSCFDSFYFTKCRKSKGNWEEPPREPGLRPVVGLVENCSRWQSFYLHLCGGVV